LSITTDGNLRAMRHQSTEIQLSERINPVVRRMAQRPATRRHSVQRETGATAAT